MAFYKRKTKRKSYSKANKKSFWNGFWAGKSKGRYATRVRKVGAKGYSAVRTVRNKVSGYKKKVYKNFSDGFRSVYAGGRKRYSVKKFTGAKVGSGKYKKRNLGLNKFSSASLMFSSNRKGLKNMKANKRERISTFMNTFSIRKAKIRRKTYKRKDNF